MANLYSFQQWSHTNANSKRTFSAAKGGEMTWGRMFSEGLALWKSGPEAMGRRKAEWSGLDQNVIKDDDWKIGCGVSDFVLVQGLFHKVSGLVLRWFHQRWEKVVLYSYNTFSPLWLSCKWTNTIYDSAKTTVNDASCITALNSQGSSSSELPTLSCPVPLPMPAMLAL